MFSCHILPFYFYFCRVFFSFFPYDIRTVYNRTSESTWEKATTVVFPSEQCKSKNQHKMEKRLYCFLSSYHSLVGNSTNTNVLTQMQISHLINLSIITTTSACAMSKNDHASCNIQKGNFGCVEVQEPWLQFLLTIMDE